MVLLSRRSSPLQIALGICLFLSTCSYLKTKHWHTRTASHRHSGSSTCEGMGLLLLLRWYRMCVMDIKRVSDENLYGKPCGLNHCSVSVLFQFFLCTWEINSFICQSLTRCPLIINPIRKWFRVQGSRWAMPLPVYWCLVLWTVRTTERTHMGYSSQIWNTWRLQSTFCECRKACILQLLLKEAWVYDKKECIMVTQGEWEKGRK